MDISQTALPALWKADPGFVALAKYLYGDEVTAEAVAKDLFDKMDPGPSDVHVNQPTKVGRGKKKRELVVDERGLQAVGKSFLDLVEKAYDAGLIDDKGDLNEVEIQKSRSYVRDHAGRFAASGGKTVAHLAAAGVLAGSGAALAAKSPKAGKYAGETIKFVGHHLKSADPVERHVARSLLPHALKSAGKATAIAGGSAVTSAGAVYEGTQAYEHMRDPFKKDWSRWDAERKGRKKTPTKQVERGVNQVGGGVVTGVYGGGLGGSLLAAGAQDKAAQQRQMFRNAQHNLRVGNMHAKAGDLKTAKTSLQEGKKFFDEGMKAGRVARGLARGSKGAAAAGVLTGAALATEGVGNIHHGQERLKVRKPKELASKSADVTWEGDFSKVDEDKRQVFGWASVTQMDGKPVIDLQGDYIHPDDVEKAAYDYVLNSRVGGDMHNRVDEHGNLIEKANQPHHVSDLIESMVFTPEKCEAMGVSKDLAGSWWTGFQINDPDVWADVKSGRRTGFSIHGAGMRKSVDLDELDPTAELIGKAYQESETVEELQANLYTLTDVTGSDEFATLAKAMNHNVQRPPSVEMSMPTPRSNSGMAWGAGLGGATGANIGTLAGVVSGKGPKADKIGGAAGGLAGAATGAVIGHHSDNKHSVPQRPPIVEAHLGPKREPMIKGYRPIRPDSMPDGFEPNATDMSRWKGKIKCVHCGTAGWHGGTWMQKHGLNCAKAIAKSVATTNRMGGPAGARQQMYQQYALQQATEQLAPQVAQHIQTMQQQKWEQQMMEQQQMAMLAGQQGQDFAVQMGPYSNSGQSNNATPQQLAPSQQMPSTPSVQQPQAFNSAGSRQA